MKKIIFLFALIALVTVSSFAAQTYTGYIKEIYTDPKQIVFRIVDSNGNLITHEGNNGDGNLFVFNYTQENARYFYSMLLTAYALNNKVRIYNDFIHSSDNGNRAHVTHGVIMR